MSEMSVEPGMRVKLAEQQVGFGGGKEIKTEDLSWAELDQRLRAAVEAKANNRAFDVVKLNALVEERNERVEEVKRLGFPGDRNKDVVANRQQNAAREWPAAKQQFQGGGLAATDPVERFETDMDAATRTWTSRNNNLVDNKLLDDPRLGGVVEAWVDGVKRTVEIRKTESEISARQALNMPLGQLEEDLRYLRAEAEILDWGGIRNTDHRRNVVDLVNASMDYERTAGANRADWFRAEKRANAPQAPVAASPDRSAAFGPGYGVRPDWRTAPQVPHDSSFFDERFLREWGIPPTYYKSDGSFGWVPADMVIALNQQAKAGKIVDRYLADAFGTATSEMNPDNVELFEQGVTVLMVLRKRISGDIEVMAGGPGGEGSPIKGFDFKKAALAIKHSESMKQALAVCMALKGKDVAGLDAIRVARGGSVVQVIEDVKRKYSKVKAVEEIEESDKHGHVSRRTKSIVVDVFTNSKEEWQAIVDNSMGEMKRELAQRTGISLGAIELAMAYAQTWGGSMGNFRWGQMRERFKLLESKGHLRDFTDRNPALYKGRMAPLSSILKNDGVEPFLDAIQTVHDEAMLEAWNYLGSLEATVLKPARLIFRGQMNMTYNKEERSRLVWAAKGTFDAQYRGSWKFDDDDVKRQIEILEKEQIDGPSISAKRAKPGNVGGVLKDLGNVLALKGEYEKFKGKS